MTSPTYMTQTRSKNAVPEQVDVAIVGAGIGGLTCGAYLAGAGYRVACFDGHYVAGGCATQFERGPAGARYAFDVGLHYVGDCGGQGTIPTLLRGLHKDLAWNELDPDGFDTLIFPDLEFRIPANRELYRERLVALFPEDRKGIDRYMRFLLDVQEVTLGMERSEGKLTASGWLRILLHHRSLIRNHTRTLAEVLDSCTQDERLRAVLAGQHGDYALPPSRASAMLHAGLCNHYLRGAYYPRGGGQMIANEVALAIEESGGSIHLRRAIRQILMVRGRAAGVVAEDAAGSRHEVRAKAVVSNADLKSTVLGLLGPEHRPRKWVTRVTGMEMPYGIFLTCLGIEGGLGTDARNANYWAFDSHDTESLYQHCGSVKDFQPHGIYVTSATLKDPDTSGHAPKGVHNVQVMTFAPGDSEYWGITPADLEDGSYRRDVFYNREKDRIEQNLIDRMDTLFPGSAARVVYRESATPLSQSRFTRSTGGTGYGIAATVDQFLSKRPGYRSPVESLYLCGASTRAGHGVAGAMTSGYLAARVIAKDLGRAVPDAYG